jgi:hypothetical protein
MREYERHDTVTFQLPTGGQTDIKGPHFAKATEGPNVQISYLSGGIGCKNQNKSVGWLFDRTSFSSTGDSLSPEDCSVNGWCRWEICFDHNPPGQTANTLGVRCRVTALHNGAVKTWPSTYTTNTMSTANTGSDVDLARFFVDNPADGPPWEPDRRFFAFAMVATKDTVDETFWIGPALELEQPAPWAVSVTLPEGTNCVDGDADCDNVDVRLFGFGDEVGTTRSEVDCNETGVLPDGDGDGYPDLDVPAGAADHLAANLCDFDALGPGTYLVSGRQTNNGNVALGSASFIVNQAASKQTVCTLPTMADENAPFTFIATAQNYVANVGDWKFDCDDSGAPGGTCIAEGGQGGPCDSVSCQCTCPGFASPGTRTLDCEGNDGTGPYTDQDSINIEELFTDRAPASMSMSGGSFSGAGRALTVEAGTDTELADTFDRPDNTDLDFSSAGQTPDFSWTDVPGSNADWDIASNHLRLVATGSSGAAPRQVRADTDLTSADHWVKWKAGFVTGTGPSGAGGVLRTQSGAGLGQHYECRCSGVGCNAIRIDQTNGTSFVAAVTSEAACNGSGDQWSSVTQGKYGACEVEGTAGSTVFRFWSFGVSDPGDRSNWGTPHCEIATTGAVDSGTRTGLRFYSGNLLTGEAMSIDGFETGVITP